MLRLRKLGVAEYRTLLEAAGFREVEGRMTGRRWMHAGDRESNVRVGGACFSLPSPHAKE